ncbi:MAG: oligosaccharide flippase family protein, partial [Candidatus Margulisiibacteriota bacterium]
MKKYITQFLQYMSPEILVTLLPFITLPITTHYLTLQDFGLIAIFTLALIPFTVISEFGSAFILSSEWFNRSYKERRPLISSLLFLSFSIRLIAIILVSIAAPFLFPILFHDSSSFIIGLFYLLVLQFFFQSFDQIFSQWLILSEKASLYTKVKLLEIILSTSNMIFLSIYTQNVTFILIGQTLIAFILFLIRGFFLVPYITYFNRDLCYEFLKIGYPFFFRSLFNQSRKTIDKLFTSSSATIESFALYNWAVRFYDLYITLESHFVKVYSPKLLSDLANESQKNYKNVFSPWFGLVLFFSTVFFFFGKEIITYISNGLYT